MANKKDQHLRLFKQRTRPLGPDHDLTDFESAMRLTMGSSRNEDIAVFEAIHGEAPELEGKNSANPLPLLIPACYMLEHMDQADLAGRNRTAVSAALERGVVTPDLGGSSTTTQMTDAIIASL